MAEAAIAAAWFDDPHGGDQLRWWDGAQWTDHVAPRPVPEPAPEPAPLPARAAVPAAVSVPVPAVADASAALAAATASSSASNSRSSLKVVGIVAGALVLLVLLLAVIIPTLLAGDPAANVGQGAPVAATGPALSPQDYATQMRAISAEADSIDDTDLGENATPDQIRAAIAPLKPIVAKMKAINPPATIATEHATLVTRYEAMIAVFEELAVNPKDEDAFGKVFVAAFSLVATIESIEKKLAVDIDGEPAAGAAPAAAPAA